MKVICSPSAISPQNSREVAFSLYRPPEHKDVGRLATHFPASVARAGLTPSKRTWDFVTIALGVAAADFGCARSSSPDGWTREIELEISVLDPEFWRTQKLPFESALEFLTGDFWNLNFISGGVCQPKPSKRNKRTIGGKCISLFSGGADSLVGAIDYFVNSLNPVLVSQVADGDKSKQREFARCLKFDDNHIQLSHAIKTSGLAERSQRSRSIVFLAYGLMAAMHLSQNDNNSPKTLIVPENGFISLNVPLTPLRTGSLSTRTTHPFFIKQVQSIFNTCGFPVTIENPYQFKTKGEMFLECLDQSLAKRLLPQSTSCGRFGRYGFMHCGRCIPCLVRRAAFNRAKIKDKTEYKYDDLSIPDRDHLLFDDVQAIIYAIQKVSRTSCEEWAGSAISVAQLESTAPYLDVASRGLKELSDFLKRIKVQ